jgi:hypothetical protein
MQCNDATILHYTVAPLHATMQRCSNPSLHHSMQRSFIAPFHVLRRGPHPSTNLTQTHFFQKTSRRLLGQRSTTAPIFERLGALVKKTLIPEKIHLTHTPTYHCAKFHVLAQWSQQDTCVPKNKSRPHGQGGQVLAFHHHRDTEAQSPEASSPPPTHTCHRAACFRRASSRRFLRPALSGSSSSSRPTWKATANQFCSFAARSACSPW